MFSHLEDLMFPHDPCCNGWYKECLCVDSCAPAVTWGAVALTGRALPSLCEQRPWKISWKSFGFLDSADHS